MKYLLANWKQNMTIKEVRDWVDVFASKLSPDSLTKNKIIIAPTFLHIFTLKNLLDEKGLTGKAFISSQDVSSFEKGSHTGEVGASQLSEVVQYSIIGHSERRALGENFEMINRKIDMAVNNGINPIVCFSNKEEYSSIISSNISKSPDSLFLFEPLFAIGTGNPATVEDLVSVHDDYANIDMIYGGSVDKSNVLNYLSCSFVKGFGVGTASLDPDSFMDIANTL